VFTGGLVYARSWRSRGWQESLTSWGQKGGEVVEGGGGGPEKRFGQRFRVRRRGVKGPDVVCAQLVLGAVTGFETRELLRGMTGGY